MLRACSALLALLAVSQTQPPKPPKPTGLKTPGVQIPMDRLKPEAIYDVPGAPDWLAIGESLEKAPYAWVSNKPKDSLWRLDAKSTAVVAVTVGTRPCSGLAIAFGSVWAPLCGDQSTPAGIARVDLAKNEVSATIPTTVGNSEGGIAAGASSLWMTTDRKGTLVRFDPATNHPVAEIVVPAGSYGVGFGENAVWVTSTDGNSLSRVDPNTNLVTDTVPVGRAPRFVAVGEGSVWTLNQGDGTVSRVDAKTKKVVATIEAGLQGPGGEIAVGEGSIWVTLIGFPITRIDPATNKVVQQFAGAGGDAIRVGLGFVWLSMLEQGQVWRLDPKRIEATISY
jgi:virginiamycin B lyase